MLPCEQAFHFWRLRQAAEETCAAIAVFATKTAVVSRVKYAVLGSFYIVGVISW